MCGWRYIRVIRVITLITLITLLRLCVASAPVYLAQVTPPHLTHDLFERFNTRMVDCGLEMLTQPGQPEPSYSAMRRARARQRMQLPLRHKGMGVLSITLRHPIAYFASVASCLVEDKTLARHVNGLRDFAADTHERLRLHLVCYVGKSSLDALVVAHQQSVDEVVRFEQD